MTTVDELFAAYRAEHRSGGEADPRPYVAQVSGTDRAELAALIDSYLARAPKRAFDREALARARENPLVQRIIASTATAESWPALLPALRNEARIGRAALVKRLTAALGVAPDKEPKVHAYYHRMEHGLLEPSGVSERVLQALAEIVGTSAQRLRTAGERLGPPAAGAPAPAFARTAVLQDEQAKPRPRAAGAPGEEPWDEVDELFRGGR